MKVKYFNVYAPCEDSEGGKHVVTVVGKFTQDRRREVVIDKVPVEVKDGSFVDGTLFYQSNKLLKRKLTLGMSICHPLDKFDEEVGIDIAKKRIERGEDLGSIETSDVTMLTEDAIMGELIVKLNHIVENIENFLP
jgi:hypothetical protein